MLFKCTPDYCDYEMVDEVIVIADTQEEAVLLAEDKAKEVDVFPITGKPQKWTAEEVDLKEKGLLTFSTKW